MDTLKQMGVQQWRLKPEFRSKPAGSGEAPAKALQENELIEQPQNLEPEQPVASDVAITEIAPAQLPSEDSPAAAEVKPLLESLDWQGLQDLMSSSENCPSCSQSNSILGSGDRHADWLFVTDAPSQNELQEGKLLVGRAGKLFDAMLAAMGLDRSIVYCACVFKCAASFDISASPQCDALLQRQIQLIQPKVVITLGEFAAQKVIRANEPLELLRQSAQQCHQSKLPIVPTYSAAEMLDQPALKALVWQDLKRAMALLGS